MGRWSDSRVSWLAAFGSKSGSEFLVAVVVVVVVIVGSIQSLVEIPTCSSEGESSSGDELGSVAKTL